MNIKIYNYDIFRNKVTHKLYSPQRPQPFLGAFWEPYLGKQKQCNVLAIDQWHPTCATLNK